MKHWPAQYITINRKLHKSGITICMTTLHLIDGGR